MPYFLYDVKHYGTSWQHFLVSHIQIQGVPEIMQTQVQYLFSQKVTDPLENQSVHWKA